MRLLRSLAMLGSLGLASGTAHAQEWSSDASYTWANNLSRTSYAPDRQNAAVLDGSVAAEWHRQLAPDWSAMGRAEAGLEQVPSFPSLDNVHVGAQGELRRKFGLGPFAPILAFSGGAARYDVHEEGRSAWKIDAGLSLSKRLTEAWRIVASGNWDEEYARAHPFDVRNRRASVETAWDVRDGWELSAGASRLWGELTANANRDIFQQALDGNFGAAVAAYYRTVPSAPSVGYGDDWVAYRIDGRADFWWLGLSVSLGENTSLPLRYEAVNVVNRAQVGYRSDFWSLSLVHRF